MWLSGEAGGVPAGRCPSGGHFGASSSRPAVPHQGEDFHSMTASEPAAGSAPDRTVAAADAAGKTGGSSRSALWQGFIGSVFMTVASIGIGWLAQSSGLRRYPLFIWMRTDPAGVVLSIALLAFGGMLLVRAWLRLGQKITAWVERAHRDIILAVIAWGAPMMAAVPLFSRDVYAYIGQGRLVTEHMNPYVQGISSLSNYYQLGADKMWAEAPTPYGQLFLWIEGFVVWVTNVQPELCVLLFRVVAVFGIVLCIIYVPKLAKLHGVNPQRALWLTAANPLFLTTFIASVHNDALMVGLAVAGIYLVATRRAIRGIALVTLSVSVKPITLIFLPFLGLLWAGKGAGWGRKIVFWILTAGLSLGILWVLSLPNGYGFGWINGLSAPGSVSIWYAPVGLLGMVVRTLGNAVGLPGGSMAGTVFTIGKVLSVAAIAWLILRGDHDRLIRRMALALAAVVFLAPMIQSWYVVWLIPLFAVTGIRNDWQVKTLYFVVSFLMIYGIADQLDVYPYLNPDDTAMPLTIARNGAAVVSLLFGLYLVFVDPKTRKLFRRQPGEITATPVL
ncbi:MAG: polyprenol phosphomannose-dependent alpha 1,6 mannosyltransferase MptB [Actinomycetales bacterium]